MRVGAPGSTPGAGARQGQRATTQPTPIGGGTRRNPKRLVDPKALIKPKNDGDALKGGMQSNETRGRVRRGERKRQPDATSGPAGSAERGPRSGESLSLSARSVRSPAPNGGVSRLRTAGGVVAAIGKERPRRRALPDGVAALSALRPRQGARDRMSECETGAGGRASRQRRGDEIAAAPTRGREARQGWAQSAAE